MTITKRSLVLFSLLLGVVSPQLAGPRTRTSSPAPAQGAPSNSKQASSPAQAQGAPPASSTPDAAPVPASQQASSAAPATSLRRDQIVRIGLSTNRERVVLSGTGRFRVVDPDSGKAVWKESYDGRLMIGVRGAPPTQGRIFRAQIGSFDLKESAQEMAAKLRALLDEPVVVAWVPDRKIWRVRAGSGDSREALSGVMAKLRSAGYPDAWISEEPVPQSGESSLVLIDSNYDTQLAPSKVLRVEAEAPGSFLAVDGKSYRGSFEVKIDLSGGIRVVNVLPVESYLRGVVPAELGPALYPEIESQKAQAVAARTYVYRNLGQFAEEGFDLCDTPRCQVYDGVKVEHVLSDKAIRETEGEIAESRGGPINALYTSTCGGHTEDAVEIFPEEAAPYLMGVPCAPELRSRKSRKILLSGDPALADAPGPEALAAAILAVHGLIPRGGLDAARLAEAIPAAEAVSWIEALRTACGIEDAIGEKTAPVARSGKVAKGAEVANAGTGADDEAPIGATSGAADGATSGAANGAGGGPTVAALAARIVERLGWQPRVTLLIEAEDPESWLPEEVASLTTGEAGAVAYFLRERVWPGGAAGLPDPARRATRGDLARLAQFAAESCALLDIDEGIVRGGDEGGLRLSGKGGKLTRGVDPKALLFADFGAGPAPVRRLAVVAGDKLRYHVGPSGTIDEMLMLAGRQGASDDRYSSTSAWQVAYTAEELANRLDQYLGSGSLLDIVAVRRGVSGRVTELKVTGTKGQAIIKGFSIRTALGLKENLFVINRQWKRPGVLRRVVFTGRGWGHGVGLCQIGSYGMAVRGASYREILSHYYTGISLETLP